MTDTFLDFNHREQPLSFAEGVNALIDHALVTENDARPTSVTARLQELGPRFTLKLMSVQKGTFDSKHGEFEYVRSTETDGTRKNRRIFVL